MRGYRRRTRTPALHLPALEKAGCKTVIKDDGLSGATAKRPALAQLAQNDNIARSAAISVGSRPGSAAPKGE